LVLVLHQVDTMEVLGQEITEIIAVHLDSLQLVVVLVATISTVLLLLVALVVVENIQVELVLLELLGKALLVEMRAVRQDVVEVVVLVQLERPQLVRPVVREEQASHHPLLAQQ